MRPKHLTAILVLLALALPASPARAAGVVSVCDEAHLKSALSGGGNVTFTCSGTIVLTAGIVISANTAIDGSGQSVILSGAHRYRVFTVNPGITLSLNRLTIADGVSPGPYGGGVFIANGTLIVSNSTFFENGAANAGGGIYGKGSQVTVSNSTFSGNWGDFDGGAIYSDSNGALTVSNSTFYDNIAGNLGGAIYSLETPAATVTNCTFFANRAWSGWSVYSDGAEFVVLKNTIVADTAEGPECRGRVTDGGGNLSYPEWSCGSIHGDPLLGPLQDNGGPTQTMAPGVGSAAIDAADDAVCAAPPVNNLDQRGATRPVGAHCDIGAVEQQPTGAPRPPSPWLDVNIDIKPGSDPNSVNCQNGNEVITVAILTTGSFDAMTVDHQTVIFGGARETHVEKKTGQRIRHEEDVDGDGDMDLVLHFRMGSTVLTCDSTVAVLLGRTVAGQSIWGAGSVRMVGGG